MRKIIVIMWAAVIFAGCNWDGFLGGDVDSGPYGQGEIDVKLLSTRDARNVTFLSIEVEGFTQRVYWIDIVTANGSKSHGRSSIWATGDATAFEVAFNRDLSGQPDMVMLIVRNDFDPDDKQFSEKIFEYQYQ